MVYVKITFSAITPLNIANLNMLGCQYAEMKSEIVVHNPSTYYTKTESNTKYVYADNDGSGTGCNAATIDGYTKAQLMASVPTGLIVWYGAALATLPAGWHLADGSVGTRNCVNKYIIGANAGNTLDTGGNDVFSPTGSITINGHQLTIAEMPAHTHGWIESKIYTSTANNIEGYLSGWYYYKNKTNNLYTGYTGNDQSHDHTGTITINSVDNRPTSKALFLIQKI